MKFFAQKRLNGAVPLAPPPSGNPAALTVEDDASLVLAEYEAVRDCIQTLREKHNQINQALSRLKADKTSWK